MTTTPTTEVAVADPVFSDVEQYALSAFLAGYRGLTRDACALHLRPFMVWCEEPSGIPSNGSPHLPSFTSSLAQSPDATEHSC